MSDGFDVLVVGAGLGGLAAAARMAREGLRVAVFEESPHPGGTAYAFRRRGFLFPMGPLGFGGHGTVGDILSRLDDEPPPRFRRVGYRLRALGVDLALSLPFDELSEELGRHFPAEREGLRRFFTDMAALATPKLMGSKLMGSGLANEQFPQRNVVLQDLTPSVKQFPQRNVRLQDLTPSVSAGDHLNALVTDESLKRILGSIGTHEPYSSLPLLAAMWRLMAEEGIWYPEGGLAGMADRLARAVTSPVRGVPGLVRLSTRVSRILVRDRRAAGLLLGDGSTIEAPAVVSNADGKTTFLDLLEPGDLPRDWRRMMEDARLTGSAIQVALGLEATFDGSAFAGSTRLVYRRAGGEEADPPDWSAAEVLPDSLASQELEIGLLSGDDAGLAPPGSHAVVIRTPADYFHFERFRLGLRRRAPGYSAYKTRLAAALTSEVEPLLPGLSRAVKVMDVSTPLTFRDQGGRTQGAVAGWSWDFEDLPQGMPSELTVTPIPGLYLAGHQARSALFSGGVPQALESGLAAAGRVLAET